MPFGSLDAVFYTLVFLVPGFIWDWALSIVVPRRPRSHERVWPLRLLTLSAINFGLWVWLISIIPSSPFFVGHPVRTGLAWAVIAFVAPGILGLMVGVLNERGLVYRLLQCLGIDTIHPIPTAWDFVFRRKASVWVLVTMTNGSTIAGFFGARSFASSDSDNRDLYIENVFIVGDDGPWREVPMNAGAWISGRNIRNIEFWVFDEDRQTLGRRLE
jgi:hypothetical protein